MPHDTIAARMGPMPLALDAAHGARFLNAAWPTAALPRPALMAGSQEIRIGEGERFAILRGVAIVPIRGLLTPDSFELERWMGWTTFAGLEATCAELAASDEVSAVIVPISSPGGYVLGMLAAADALHRLAQVKPVYGLADPMAASAAYALASQCTTLAVVPGGVVGSIGVMTERAVPVAPGMSGWQSWVMTSTHARAKRPDPSTDLGRAEITRALDEAEAAFHELIVRGRRIGAADLLARLSVTDDPADGGAEFGPAAAVARGLADTTEDRAAFYSRVFAAHPPPVARPARPARSARAAQARAAVALALTRP